MSGVFLPFPSPKYSTKSLLNVVQVLNKTEETVENMVDYISLTYFCWLHSLPNQQKRFYTLQIYVWLRAKK